MANGSGGVPGSVQRNPSPAPAADPIGSAINLLAQIVAVLAAVLRAPVSDLSKVVKVRRKAAKLVPQLLELAINRPVYAPLGSDPQALLAQWNLAISLAKLLTPLEGLHKQVGGTVLQLEAEAWKVALVIQGLASANAGGDASVIALTNQVKAALKVGKAQQSVKTPIAPTPVKGGKAKKALLAAAKAKAGIPASVSSPGSPSAPAEPVPSLAPKPPNGGSGPVSGSGQ